MCSFSRLSAAGELAKHRAKYTFAVFFVFFARFLLAAASVFTVFFLVRGGATKLADELFGGTAAKVCVYIAGGLLILLFVQTGAGLRLGLSGMLCSAASGGSSRYALIFRYCTPIPALKALYIYSVRRVYKLLWLAVTLFPATALACATLMLYGNGRLTNLTFAVLCGGTALLLITSFPYYAKLSSRYDFAPYIFFRRKCSVRKAFNKSAELSQLSNVCSLRLRRTFLAWFASCVMIVPMFYVIPYYQLSRAFLYSVCRSRCGQRKPSTSGASLVFCRRLEADVR